MRQEYFHYVFIQENYPILHTCEWQRYINLIGPTANLKVKLEFICSEGFSGSGMTIIAYPDLFKEQGSIKVWSWLWMWIMAQTKQISKDLRK